MAGYGLKWAGLLKWSLSYADGTRPPCPVSEERRRWFIEAMQARTVNVVNRMKEIALVMRTPEDVLEAQGITPSDIEDMLIELKELVEPIDAANDLHLVGGLLPLLSYLRKPNACIRAKAAEVVSVTVHNNARNQQFVNEAGGLEPLLSNFTSDPDMTVRTEALGAISSLIRNNKSGIAAFRLANGYAGLRDALSSDSVKCQRKAASLIQYLLQEDSSDCSVVMELGFHRLMMHLVSSNDSGVREAALGGLLELARKESRILLAQEGKLRQLLRNRMESIKSMSPSDLAAAREERQLVDSLWSACYHEPSLLRKEGLLVLPGEDLSEPPPDVAGKFFEPPLCAWTSNPANETKKQNSLLLGPGPPGGMTDYPGDN
ncbi:uncharacterized protein [Typha latifolia]|uniref:uncharacterized protein isoform X1 n=1 Tax=Typha latifolia TaxID=4733 RepID=UPI003C2D901F